MAAFGGLLKFAAAVIIRIFAAASHKSPEILFAAGSRDTLQPPVARHLLPVVELMDCGLVEKLSVHLFLQMEFIQFVETKNDLVVHTRLLGGLEWPNLVVEN